MKLKVLRLGDNGKCTIGAFYIDGILKCFTIEDEERQTKVSGETRIPNGTYSVKLRNEGGMNEKYKAKYPSIHKGMLCIHNSPDWKLKSGGMEFQYILIHEGNLESNTEGCLLLNYVADTGTYTGARSADAYKAIYPIIANHLLQGGEVTIEYVDVETGK